MSTFDTLKFAQTLRDKARFTPEQAEGLSEAFSAATSEQLATKTDISTLKTDISAFRAELKTDMSALKAEMTSDMSMLKAEIRANMAMLGSRMDTRFKELQPVIGGMIVGLGGVLVAVKFLGH